ncbi:glycoside hydrolase family 3 protein [Lachnoclostridium sp. Marseille-P6806]|uniref:glycoside hydrolase family 3 protein n=1 Tax=Lachnoclostridium sp. Marseille-P6806 TaxID=2364793 RepID=UPI0010308C4F|nr:glycoside hydrolase family 3 N-terminal domain-containing protein [Lachnoclostridium sp. Marseille-P6806]
MPVDLRQKPYDLTEGQIERIESMIAGMSLREKVGQLFIAMVGSREERAPEKLRELIDRYHPGGIRYQNAEKEEIYDMADTLQQCSRIPLLIAANCEQGGSGGVKGGTPLANGAALAAINDEEAVYEMARAAGEEAKAVGCNWNFAPVVDLTFNWRNTIVQNRAFCSSPDEVIRYSRQFLRAMREQNIASCIKHFPGDGTEENDQHLMMGVNNLEVGAWEESFGKVYRVLIDDGVLTIMAGHIALPHYQRKLVPGLRDRDIRPATLAPELIGGLLKGVLGFNGMVLTDASHMIGMFGSSLRRSEQVPRAIAAGCDMFLFFNDGEEDFGNMLRGVETGIITEERLHDALRRILGVKAHIGLLDPGRERMPDRKNLECVGSREHHALSARLADRFVTLVKDTRGYLPMTVKKYRRLKLFYVGSEDMVIAGRKIPSDDREVMQNLISELEGRGYEVDASVPLSKGSTEEFRSRYDAVLLVLNIQGFAQYNTMRVKWDEPVKQPWYMSELPTFTLSLGFTNLLIDVPMARCYINAYMPHREAIAAAIDKMEGKTDFKGRYNENVFCGRWDTAL